MRSKNHFTLVTVERNTNKFVEYCTNMHHAYLLYSTDTVHFVLISYVEETKE